MNYETSSCTGYFFAGFCECSQLNKTVIYDANFIQCVTVHPPDDMDMISFADPSSGFQLVTPIGNIYGKTIEYNKHNSEQYLPDKVIFIIIEHKNVLLSIEIKMFINCQHLCTY